MPKGPDQQKSQEFHKEIQERLESYGKKLYLEYKQHRKQVKEMKAALKQLFTKEKSEDLAITKDEQNQIFNSIPEELKEKFNIKSPEDLMKFIGISEIMHQKRYNAYKELIDKGDPDTIIYNASKISKYPWSKKLIFEALFGKSKNESSLQELSQLRKLKYYKEIEDRLIKERPGDLIRNFESYKNESWGFPLIEKAALANPKEGISNGIYYRFHPKAEELLRKLAYKDPDNIHNCFLYLPTVPWGKNIMKLAFPDQLTKHFKKYSYATWAEEVFTYGLSQDPKFTKFMKESDLATLLKNETVKSLLNVPWGKNIMKKYNPKAYNLHLKHLPYTNPTFKSKLDAALKTDDPIKIKEFIAHTKKTTLETYQNLDRFIKKPWALDALITAVSRAKHGIAFAYISKYKHLPGAIRVLESVSLKRPRFAFVFFKQYQDIPGAVNVINKITAKYNMAPFQYYAYIKDTQHVEKIMLFSIKQFTPKDFVSEATGKFVMNSDVPKKYKKLFEEKKKKCIKIAEVMLSEQIKSNLKYGKGKERTNQHKHIYNFLQDPSLRDILKVNTEWLDPKPNNERARIQFQVMITRNLYRAKLPVNKLNVIHAYHDILDFREEIGNKLIFDGEKIHFIAHNEKFKKGPHKGKHIWGLKHQRDAIRRQGGKLPPKNFHRAKETKKSLLETKKNVLTAMEDPSNSRFIFDIHGGPHGLYLSHGQMVDGKPVETEDTIKISDKEFADALIKRYEKDPNCEIPVFIFMACQTSAFIINASKLIGDKAEFIALGYAEYGQNSREAVNVGNNSSIGLTGNPRDKTTLGDLVNFEGTRGRNNASFYIHRRGASARLRQFARKGRKRGSAPRQAAA